MGHFVENTPTRKPSDPVGMAHFVETMLREKPKQSRRDGSYSDFYKVVHSAVIVLGTPLQPLFRHAPTVWR